MFLTDTKSEAYWNSYRLLEKQLIKLSHSIYFDDKQIDVYSSELADIVSSACIKIESLAKDIYEEHICPFQMDNAIIPKSYTDGKNGRKAENFKVEKWTRKEWKYDYNCLIEIDEKYSISKKVVQLKLEKFHFRNYGSSILPFNNISVFGCKGGKWEYFNHDMFMPRTRVFTDVDWCKSYQEIKHNYIQSINKNGTVKNAIIVLSAFYLLTICRSFLPLKTIDYNYQISKHEIDFDSELFYCGMQYYTLPQFIIDSDYIKFIKSMRESQKNSPQKQVFEEQNMLDDIEGYPFLIILNQDTYKKVQHLVNEFCEPRGVKYFDIAPFENENELTLTNPDAKLYLEIKKFIKAPYPPNNLCVAFNVGAEKIYERYNTFWWDYESSKFKNRNKEVLSTLQVGNFVDVKFSNTDEISNCEVKELNEHIIILSISVNKKSKTLQEPVSNIVYIKKRYKH